MTDDGRPDPDALLARVQQEEAQARRGKLKIFFGASAGVGKTCAMPSAAQAARVQGIAVVVGIVETHGRAETQALLDGLPLLPMKVVDYRGKQRRAAFRRHRRLVDDRAWLSCSGARCCRARSL